MTKQSLQAADFNDAFIVYLCIVFVCVNLSQNPPLYISSALLTDVSNAFDCPSHKFMDLHCGIESNLQLLNKQEVGDKSKLAMQFLVRILFDRPQRSILGPYLFKIFLRDLFFIMSKTDFTSFADDNTTYRTTNNIKVIQSLQHDSMILFKWFSNKQMKAI